jgi:hypothetical protein
VSDIDQTEAAMSTDATADTRPKKTEAELREVAALLDSSASYGDFPDGCTWDDVDDALVLKALDEAKGDE